MPSSGAVGPGRVAVTGSEGGLWGQGDAAGPCCKDRPCSEKRLRRAPPPRSRRGRAEGFLCWGGGLRRAPGHGACRCTAGHTAGASHVATVVSAHTPAQA